MALRKTHAAYFKDGVLIPQRDIDMHALEEHTMNMKEAIHVIKKSIIKKLSQSDEHEMLIEHGPVYVKQKRDEYQKSVNDAAPTLQAAEKAYQDAHGYWNSHCELCVINGHDPDTFVGDANQLLKKPE